MALFDSPTTAAAAKHDGAYRGKRLSWSELWELRPDLRPNRQADVTPAAHNRPWCSAVGGDSALGAIETAYRRALHCTHSQGTG